MKALLQRLVAYPATGEFDLLCSVFEARHTCIRGLSNDEGNFNNNYVNDKIFHERNNKLLYMCITNIKSCKFNAGDAKSWEKFKKSFWGEILSSTIEQFVFVRVNLLQDFCRVHLVEKNKLNKKWKAGSKFFMCCFLFHTF